MTVSVEDRVCFLYFDDLRGDSADQVFITFWMGVMDKLLFGDNQFFGVNHMSEEKARAQSMRFRDMGTILAVLNEARSAGINTFMCTTHERVAEICDVVRDCPAEYSDLKFFPCMPYAHKYANALTDDGLMGAIRRFLPDEGVVDAAIRGGRSVATRDIGGITTLLIDSEMKMFRGLRTPVIFLQNVIVDLLLGLGIKDSFRIFADHIRRRYNAEPGFITMNLPRLLDTLAEVGVENPIVCSNINKIGFRMCGGMAQYRKVLEEREFRAIAMSIFASGAIPPAEAISWIFEQPNIESIVFGASSRANIVSTQKLVDAATGGQSGIRC